MRFTRFIKVTSLSNKESIYVNVEELGHFYRVPEKMNFGSVEEVEHTRMGVTTHNNGGFMIVETPKEVLELIKNASII
jgi:hypothetical protein